MNIRVDLTYSLARRLVARRQARHGAIAVAADWESYAEWREQELRNQLINGFGAESVKGKVALDFGCGDGALCTLLMDLGAQEAHGVDLSQVWLDRFEKRLQQYKGDRKPTYSLSSSSKRIDQPDRKFDAIYCFDVLEHVIDYRESIGEWHRVLKPGGSVYIWWQPYWHPYGHHVYDWIPIPWAHAFLDDHEMREVCARIVDWDGFDPPVWDRNADGTKKNRFREVHAGNNNYLNKLTVREFESACKQVGFKFARREFEPFGMPQPARAISAVMTKVPVVRDFFTACALYELVRPLEA